MRLLPPPKDFGPDERDVWNAAQRQLRAQDTWTGRSDVPLLEAYCRNAVLARKARMAAKENGAADKLKVAADCEAAVHPYGTSLLLTPESRKRHGVKSIAAGEDELSRLIAH
jgi:phage terminase small subunit